MNCGAPFPEQWFERGLMAMLSSSQEVIPMPAPLRAKEPPIETLPLEERIRRRAYELYVHRNQSGSEFDDWLQAEVEISRAEEEAIAVLDER